MRRLMVTAVLIAGLGAPAAADFDAGMAAYNRGSYDVAYREWLIEAERGDVAAQYSIGAMHLSGRGVAKNYAQARRWFQTAADAGHAGAQESLAKLYYKGFGIDQDLDAAAAWYRLAAEQGLPRAQHYLGHMYINGEGVNRDLVDGYFWLNLAARGGHDQSVAARDKVGQMLSAVDFARVQRRLREWKPLVGQAPPSRSALGKRPISTATGFLVSGRGHVLTNAHAVKRCKTIAVKSPNASGIAELITSDGESDLALLKLDGKGMTFAAFRASEPVRLGASVAVFGYPLQGIVAFGANITNGIVSGLAGPNNDEGVIQTTAPVQPGNSGGPLLDSAGNVVGVVVSKLNALKVAEVTGVMPQNVNFAIKAGIARRFLAAHGVPFVEAPSQSRLTYEDIAVKAEGFTVMLECWD